MTAADDAFVMLAPYALIDIGARYRFKRGKSAATFRAQMRNAANRSVWDVVGSNSYGLLDKRRVTAFLAVDL